MKLSLARLLTLLAAYIATLGCAATPLSSAYEPRPRLVSSPPIDLLVVSRAIESRPLQGRSRIGVGFLALIPLVPYAHQQITPERYFGNAGLAHDFLQDVADTVAKDLQAAGVARVVTSHTDASQAAISEVGAYRLSLTLADGIWHRNITFYGLSFAGAIIILIAPMSDGSAELALTAELRDPEGTPLGSSSFKSHVPIREWGPVPHRFPRALPLAYAGIAPDLRAFVAEGLKDRGRTEATAQEVAAPDGRTR